MGEGKGRVSYRLQALVIGLKPGALQEVRNAESQPHLCGRLWLEPVAGTSQKLALQRIVQSDTLHMHFSVGSNCGARRLSCRGGNRDKLQVAFYLPKKIQETVPRSLTTTRRFSQRCSAKMAPATVRRAPYKDFLQPALHRRFSTTATILLGIAYIQALWLASWNSCMFLSFPRPPLFSKLT